MKPSDVDPDVSAREALVRLHEDFNLISDRYLHAVANLRAWEHGGFPTSGSGRGGAGDHADPTAALVIAETTSRSEPYTHALAEIEAHMVALRAEARWLARVVSVTTNVPVAKGAPGCDVCAQAKLPAGAHKCDADCKARDHEHPAAYREIYTRRPDPSDPEKTVALCSFCTEFVERYGEIPALAVTLHHLDHLGAKIPKDLIRAHHEDAFNRYHGGRRKASGASLAASLAEATVTG